MAESSSRKLSKTLPSRASGYAKSQSRGIKQAIVAAPVSPSKKKEFAEKHIFSGAPVYARVSSQYLKDSWAEPAV